MVKLSVLITVCNAQEYLHEVMDQVTAQEMQELEIICVDDASTDDTPLILTKYAKKDRRVRILRQKQSIGRPAARRAAAEAAKGQYALLLDTDVLLSSDACEKMVQEISRKEADVLQFGIHIQEEERLPAADPRRKGQAVSYGPEEDAHLPDAAQDARTARPGFAFTVWNRVCSTQVLQKAFAYYDEVNAAVPEDVLAAFLIDCHAASYSTVSDVYYIYRKDATAVYQMLSRSQIDEVCSEYQVIDQLRELLPQLPVDASAAGRALKNAEKYVTGNVLTAFCCCTPEWERKTFLDSVCGYCSLTDFLENAVACCETDRWLDLTKLTACLRGCIPSSARPVKTIGTVYNRFYNGGIERVIALTLPLWQQMGYQVILFTEEPPNEQDYPLPDGVWRVVLPKTRNNADRYRAWRQLLRRHPVDLMVYHEWVGPSLMTDSLAIKEAGIPFVVYAHGRFCCCYNDWRLRNQRETYALCDAVVALTDTDQAWWSALGLRSLRINNPLTYLPSQLTPVAQPVPTAVWVGRISPEKQFSDALEIAALVRKKVPEFRLIVVGQPAKEENWEDLKADVLKRDLQECVQFVGFRQDVAPLYAQAGLLLHTSKEEGWGMVFLEAAAFGLPIVAYELPNVDLLRGGNGCTVVQQQNVDAAAKAIVELLQQPEKWHTASAAVRAATEQIEQTDLKVMWQAVFDAACQPMEPYEALSRRAPMQTAICLAMQEIAVTDRRKNTAAENQGYEKRIEQLQRTNAAYAVMVKEMTGSTAYRAGQLITWPMRALKKLLGRA